MTRITQKDVIEAVRKSFEDGDVRIDIDSSAATEAKWDSLIQLNIIMNLDTLLAGEVGAIGGLATAKTVRDIVTLLKDHGFVEG